MRRRDIMDSGLRMARLQGSRLYSEGRCQGQTPRKESNMLARYGIAYLATGLSFAAIDAAWLSRMGPTFYKGQLGEMMLARPRFDAAIAFYLIYIAGIVFFAVAPAFGHGGTGWKTALTY